MRFAVALLSSFIILGTISLAAAYYYDDSVVIEIGDGVPQPPSDDEPSGGGSVPGGGGSSGGSSDTGGMGQGGSGSGSAGSGTTGQGGSSSGGSGTSTSGDISLGSGGGSGDSALDTLFELLVTQGAITGGTWDPNAPAEPGSGAGGSNAAASVGGGTTINAAKLRAALRGNDSFRNILEDYSSGYRSGAYRFSPGRSFGLFGASAILADSNIEELTFGATKFEIVYRSRGYLIGFIPKTFPVRIAIDPQASAAPDRVVLTLPWYRFILRKLFTTSTLAREIDAVVMADVPLETDTPADVQARLFDVVSLELQKKVGAVRVDQPR